MAKHRGKTELLTKDSFELNGFEFTETSCTVKEGVRPSRPQFQGTLDFVRRAHKSSGFWLVDLIKYFDGRPDWKEFADMIIDAEVLAESTLKQYRYLGKHMLGPEERVDGAGFGLHAKVAALPHDEQIEWLEKAKDHGWGQQDLAANVQAAERTKFIDGQATLAGMFRVIYADPPWKYNQSNATLDGSLAKQASRYPGMTIEELCKLPVKAHALPDSILFMWVTAPFLLQNPGPREVIEAWGFEPKGGYVWDKVLGNPGSYNHVVHEHLIVATRGSCLPDVPTPQPKSVQIIRRSHEHSAKPDEFRRLIETHWNRGPYLELFGRKPVDGWSVFGNDARLWTKKDHAPPIKIDDDEVPF